MARLPDAEVYNLLSAGELTAWTPHTKIDAPGREPDPPIESALSDLVGRATLREVRDVLDRWLLGRVLEEHGGNVTRTAARLGISRRRVRERRAAVVDGDRPSPAPREKDTNPPVVPFPLPSLTALVEGSGTYSDVHETVGRWLAACVLEQEGGNVSSAARILGVGRRLLRELRDGSS